MKKINNFVLPSRKDILSSHNSYDSENHEVQESGHDVHQKNVYTYNKCPEGYLPVKNPLFEAFNTDESREILELKFELETKEKALRELEKKFTATQRSLSEREMLSKAKEDYLKNRSLQISDRETRLLKQIKEQKKNAPIEALDPQKMDERIKREMERLNNFSSELDKREYELREREQMLQERENFTKESEDDLMSKAQELHEKEMELEIREDAIKDAKNVLKSA